MGILDFKFKTNFMHELEHPVLFVAKKNKTLLSPISIYESFNPTFRFNGFQEVSFEVYREVNGKRQECYDYLEDGKYLFVQGVCWYEMHVEESNDGTGWKKSVSATSLESMLSKKNLVDFECNTGEILYDDYVKTIFYDPTNHKGSLLHRVLDVCPTWTIGHVDASLQNKQRSFDISSQDVYSFLTNDVSEAFNCIFLFDTFNCTVNAYDLDNYGKDSNIFVSMENLAENMTISIEENSIFTCYRVYGGDGVYINEVNPNGTNKIYNFDYYLDEMDENLRSKILGYKELRSSLIEDYESVMLRMQECVDKILEYENRVPESFMSKDWTEYGLSMLKTQKDSRVNIDEMYKAQKMNIPSSIYYDAYVENKTELEEIKKEIEVRQEEIDEQYAIYDEMKYERDELQDKMSMSEWFTVDEWKQLDAYVIEETYTNDNYIVTDLEDDAERFDIERQLLKVATEDLQKKSRPQYQYSGTLLNLLSIPGLENFAEYFSLGNFIFSETSFGEKIKLRLIEFSIDYDNQETINVTFSDATRVKDVYEDTASIISQANSAGLSFKFNKTQYDKASKEGNYVADLRKYGLDVAKTRIHNSSNQNQVWDSTGMTFREWNDQKQAYEPEQMKIINNLLVFTDDGGETVKTALGKVYMGDQEYAWGLNAEILLGKLIMSEQLYVENESGTFTIEDKGFSATKGTNTVKIQPGEEKLFSITKGSTDLFYLDDKGNLHFKGDLTGSNGTFSGTLNGADGNFSGTLNGSIITGGSISGAEISGGSINGGTIIGGTIEGTEIIGGTGSFEGEINATSGKIGCLTVTSSQLYYDKEDSSTTLIEANKINTGIIDCGSIYTHYIYPIVPAATGNSIVNTIEIGSPSTIVKINGISGLYNTSFINFKSGNIKTGTYGGYYYHVSAADEDSNDTWVASTEYVKNRISNQTPASHSHSEYASSSHTHSGYASSSHSHYSGDLYSQSGNYSGGTYYTGDGIKIGSVNVATCVQTNTACSNAASKSDKRLKYDLNDLYGIEDFYLELQPRSFKFKTKAAIDDNSYRTGLIAQEVEELLNKYGLTNTGIVAERESYNEEIESYSGNTYKIINYDDFHAFHIAFNQSLYRKIEKQKQDIFSLQGEIAILKQQINELVNQ